MDDTGFFALCLLLGGVLIVLVMILAFDYLTGYRQFKRWELQRIEFQTLAQDWSELVPQKAMVRYGPLKLVVDNTKKAA